jgi:hypothetical protein
VTPITLLVVFGLLQTKHFLADYVWQTGAMVRTKGIYGHPVGASHSLLHAVLTALVLVVATPAGALLVIAVAVGEFVLHYHTDWFKDRLTRMSGKSPEHWEYWVLVGADQYVHHLTYVAIPAVLVYALG